MVRTLLHLVALPCKRRQKFLIPPDEHVQFIQETFRSWVASVCTHPRQAFVELVDLFVEKIPLFLIRTASKVMRGTGRDENDTQNILSVPQTEKLLELTDWE